MAPIGWRFDRLLRSTSVKGRFDTPALRSEIGRHSFRGWAANTRPIEEVVFEMDGLLYRPVELHPRADVPRTSDFPHVTGWQVVVEVMESRRSGKRLARVLVDGKTAATAAFAFEREPARDHAVASDESSERPAQRFAAAASELPAGSRVLELGTRQAVEGVSTHHRPSFPGVARADYVMCDVLPGADVDVMHDLHDLPVSWASSFDAFVAYAVFEHLERPWIAAKEVARILKPGGISLVATHQCFPLHGYPSDFFRFSKEALSLIFEDAGLEVVEAAYNARATITAPSNLVPPSFHHRWNATWPSYIYVAVFAKKRP